MSRIWFTSDLHLNHDREFIWGHRGFSDVEDMNSHILDSVFSSVVCGDVVVVLGDLAMSKEKGVFVNDFFGGLNILGVKCVWHLGNHDNPKHGVEVADRFGVHVIGMNVVEPLVFDDRFVTSHFPLSGVTSDPREAHLPFPVRESVGGRVLLHGHTHDEVRFGDGFVHVGWDAWGRLVSLSEISSGIM